MVLLVRHFMAAGKYAGHRCRKRVGFLEKYVPYSPMVVPRDPGRNQPSVLGRFTWLSFTWARSDDFVKITSNDEQIAKQIQQAARRHLRHERRTRSK